ncbi:hypothetical protein PN499_26380 [Kamptonema animale CS-326]|jgi:hypothetical protein|uniref:hypothetical protein n=1 Tax=Kamptonema animale TaxID=92934 RepID=UPI00232CDEB5|nr:hypothetical protein [Kamptonema animale]MDB9514735.1 hypothetical protein [Kamptonema animale CS-326]
MRPILMVTIDAKNFIEILVGVVGIFSGVISVVLLFAVKSEKHEAEKNYDALQREMEKKYDELVARFRLIKSEFQAVRNRLKAVEGFILSRGFQMRQSDQDDEDSGTTGGF